MPYAVATILPDTIRFGRIPFTSITPRNALFAGLSTGIIAYYLEAGNVQMSRIPVIGLCEVARFMTFA
jgi:hypothetical protein